MIVTSKIRLDMAQPGNTNPVYVVQGDGNTRSVEAELLANGSSWTPDDGWEAAITYRKPDGTKGLYNLLDDGSSAITISGSTATVILAQQMMTVPGTVRAAIAFNNQRLDQLTSFPFIVSVSRNQFAGAQQSEDYIRLQWLEDKLEEYLRKAADSGAFDGAPGPRGEPGPQGPQGPQGPKGEPGVSTTVNGKTPDEAGNVTLTADDVGALPSSGGDMTGAINMNGQPVSGLNAPTKDTQAANKGYVDTAVRKAAPRNLLDNSDFRNPVNQRGQTSYSSVGWGYCIDRWMTFNCGMEVTSDGIKITGSADELIFGQRLSINIAKNFPACTLAYCTTDGVIHFSSDKYAYSNFYEIWIRVSPNTVIQWAALYEGEYTAETLPEYQPKGYATELHECQRYFYLFDASTDGFYFPCIAGITQIPGFAFPVKMRTVPSMTIERLKSWTTLGFTDISSEISSKRCTVGGLQYIECTTAFSKSGLIDLKAYFVADI